eukprot:tig00000903_g5529.t1
MAKHCFRTYSMPGRVVGCELRFADNVQVFVASVYLPPGESRTSANTESARIIEYMRNNILADWAARHKAHLFLLGDFNSCVCPATGRIRNARYASSHEPEHRWWRELLSESAWNLRDAAKLAGTDDQITFIFPDKQRGPDEPGPEPRGITATGHLRTAARLDYILQSTAAGAGLRAVQVSPRHAPYESDHFPVLAEYDRRGLGLQFSSGPPPAPQRPPRFQYGKQAALTKVRFKELLEASLSRTSPGAECVAAILDEIERDAAAPPQQRLTRLSAALDGALDRVKEIGQSADFGMYTPARKTQKNSGAPGRRRDTDPTPRLADSPWRNAPQPRWLEHYDVFLAWVSALDKKVDLHIRGFETKRILHLRLVLEAPARRGITSFSMAMALRRLRIPEKYIQLYEQLTTRRKASVLTGYGPTEPFDVECGLPQGAYADDTVLISSSARGVQLHADLVSEFFWIHDIALNAKKTEFTYNNVSPEPKPPLLGPPGAKERAHHVLPPTKPFKFLGVWFTADLNWRHQFEAVYTMAQTACAILKKKKLTAKEAVYIVNSVLIPRITYACKVVAYTERQCAQIDTLWMTLVKHQARLRRSAPNALIWSRGFYGLKRLADEQLAIHVLDETIRANHPTLRPYLLHRVFAAQEKLCLPLPPYCYPNLDPGPTLRRDHLALAIARNMNAEGYILDSGRSHLTPALPHPRLERRFVLTTLLPPALLRSAAPFLWEHDLLTAADITGPDGRTVLDWASLWGSGRVRQRLGRAPSWFPDFLRAICEPVPPRKLPRSLRFPMHVLKQGARRQQTLFEANLMSPPYVEGQFAWHPQGYLTRIVSKWEERDEDDGRLRVYVRLEHWIWRDRTIRDGDGEGAARFYKCTMLKDECDARYTTDDATAKAARQRCDHSEPESGACQWTEDSIHIHPARLLELITPATRTRKHEPYAVVKLESQEWWTEFRTTLFLPPWERDWDYEADPSAQPQPPSGYKQRRPGTVPPRTAPPVYPDRQPLEHFLIDPEPLADPFWNLVAQELRREELPAARPPRVAATDASTTGFGSEAALTAYAGVWTRDHEQNAAHSPADRQREAQRRSEEDDAPQAAALRELAEAIPTDGSDFFVAPCPGTVNNNKAAFAPTSRTICERLQKSISTAEPSPPPPEGHPPRARDGQRCGRLRIGCTPGARTRFRALITTCPSTSIERQTRKARREERQRRRDALAALGPHVPALAGLPIAQRMERRRSPCTPAPRSPRQIPQSHPTRRLGCRKTCMASTA